MQSFSFFNAPVRNVIPNSTADIATLMQYQTSDAVKRATEELRRLTTAEERRDYKANKFPFVTFGGTFCKRGLGGLMTVSGYICFDFDHVAPFGTVQTYQERWCKAFPPLYSFISPSGDGIKMVYSESRLLSMMGLQVWDLSTSQNPDQDRKQAAMVYSSLFDFYSNYFQHIFGCVPDPACRDITRCCYIPYDPKPVYNPFYYAY